MNMGRQEEARLKLNRPGTQGRKRAARPANNRRGDRGFLSTSTCHGCPEGISGGGGPADENNSPSCPDSPEPNFRQEHLSRAWFLIDTTGRRLHSLSFSSAAGLETRPDG